MAADPLLDRDLALAPSAEIRSVGKPVLREVIDYGIGAFRRCSAVATGLDTPLGVLFPFLHCIEMLDGTEVLLDSAAGIAANVTLRAAFEALLSCEYVAKKDSERRGAAYVVAEVHARLINLERHDPESSRGKAYRADLQRDAVGRGIQLPTYDDIPKQRTEWLSILAQPHLVDAATEYEAVKKKRRGKTPPFYALWGGPGNLEQLARVLERSSYYEILYRPWSKTAHAADLGRQLAEKEGRPAIHGIRPCTDLTDEYAHAINIGLEAIRALLSKYRPYELTDYSKWYMEKISPGYKRLAPPPSPDSNTP